MQPMTSYNITRKIHSWKCFIERINFERDWVYKHRSWKAYGGLFADGVELGAVNVLEHKRHDR